MDGGRGAGAGVGAEVAALALHDARPASAHAQRSRGKDRNFPTGTRTLVFRVRAEYPNQLDYSGFLHVFGANHPMNPLHLAQAITLESEITRFIDHTTCIWAQEAILFLYFSQDLIIVATWY